MLHIKTWEELTKEELYALLRLRQEVFVLEQVCPFVDNDNFDQKSIHVWAEEDGELTAYGRIVPPGTEFKELSVGRFVTAEKYRGKGMGKQIVQACIDEGYRLFGRKPIKITAQWVYVGFYKSFGFEPAGEEFHLDHIPHVHMVKP